MALDLYGGRDPKELPAYPIGEVAQFLRLPKSTLRSWTLGQDYRTKGGPRRFEPIIQIASRDERMMSFMDLVEAHVLSALRRQHLVKLDVIRAAVKRIRRTDPKSFHPLAQSRFATDGVNLFLEEVDRLVNLSKEGQLGLRECLEGYLRRIEHGESGLATRLYPFTRKGMTVETPTRVMIDPRIAFGRPVITGTGIPTATVFERYFAGETRDELSEDYERPVQDIDEAIRWEHARAA